LLSDTEQDLQDLDELVDGNDPLKLQIVDLKNAVRGLDSQESKLEIGQSPGLDKLQKLLVETNTPGSAISKFLDKCQDGIDLVQQLGRSYNRIAEWCALPQIPKFFLGLEKEKKED